MISCAHNFVRKNPITKAIERPISVIFKLSKTDLSNNCKKYKVSQVEIFPLYLPDCDGTNGSDFAIAKL